MHILALRGGVGPNFRLLGISFDHGLSMQDAVHDIVGEATWKMGAILRTHKFFNDKELVNLYKSKLLSFLEYRTAAIYHACDSVLAPLNAFQDKFLRELGISAEDALMHFHLAPLECRRDIAMLGLIHRYILGKSHAHFDGFFQLGPRERRSLRRRVYRTQLVDIRNTHVLEMGMRSAFG